MSGKTQFWLGSIMLALAVGMIVGGLLYPKPSYSQGLGEGRTGNYALVHSDLKGVRPNSGIFYVLDDRNEVLYIFETSGRRGVTTEFIDGVDLRYYGARMQKKRAEDDARLGPKKF